MRRSSQRSGGVGLPVIPKVTCATELPRTSSGGHLPRRAPASARRVSLRDPTALRDCIELYEGQRLAPGPRPAAFQQPPVIDQSLLDAAGPIPATGVSRRGKRRKLRQSRRPATPAQSVQVEQLAPPQ